MFYQWQCGRFLLNLDNPKVMGIVNLTPDSFSDGGTYSKTFQTALAHAEQLLKDGADILDIGGESTRPNANHISSVEEWARVEPVLKEVMKWNIPVSLDTRHTLVMKQALDKGIDIINDVAALSDDGAVNLLASYHQVGICLMHMKGTPENMQQQPHYDDVVSEVINYLKNRVTVCADAGISSNRLVVDPGFGFGKTLSHNIELMQHLGDFLKEINLPLLIGVSRKRMIGELSGEKNISMRVFGSVAAALASVSRGAQIVRVHDVKATVEALNVWKAIGVFE